MPSSSPTFVPVSAWLETSPTTVRLRFSLKVLANAALTTAANYSVASNTVSSVVVIADDPYAVKLTLGTALSGSAAALLTITTAVILDSTSTYAITSPGNTVQIKPAVQGVPDVVPTAKVRSITKFVVSPLYGGVIAAKVASKPNPPTIDNYVPASGSHLAATDTFTFDVKADGNGLLRSLVWIVLGGLGNAEEAVWDGSAFTAPYSLSTRVPITNGFRYTLKRNSPGWPAGSITPVVRAYDKSGQETIA